MNPETFKPTANDNSERFVTNDNERERGYDTYDVLSERVTRLVDAAQESVQEMPEVFVNGEPVRFNPETDTDLIKLAEAQQLLGSLQQYAQGLEDADRQLAVALTHEQQRERRGVALLIGGVRGHINVLMARSDAVSEARRHPEAIKLVEASDLIARELTPPSFSNDNDPKPDAQTVQRN